MFGKLGRKIRDKFTGRVPSGTKRSPKWEKVRKDFLKKNPACAVCGSTRKVEVHHCQPFHEKPELELVSSNLITLCLSQKGVKCHLLFGHLLSYKDANTEVFMDAKLWNKKLKENKERIKTKKNEKEKDNDSGELPDGEAQAGAV